jgi:hypothetical protein
MLSETNRELGDFHDCYTRNSVTHSFTHTPSVTYNSFYRWYAWAERLCLAVHSPSSPEPTAGRVHFRKLSQRCANAYASEHLKAFCCFCNLLLQLNQYLNSTSHGFACFAIMAIANVRAKREAWLFCESSPTSVSWMPICDCSAMRRS